MHYPPNGRLEREDSSSKIEKVKFHQDPFVNRIKRHAALASVVLISAIITLMVAQYPGKIKIEWPGGKFELDGNSRSEQTFNR